MPPSGEQRRGVVVLKQKRPMFGADEPFHHHEIEERAELREEPVHVQ